MTERSIFLAVLEIPNPAERSAYLDQACAGDPALRAQVEQLLKAHQEPSPFMERPAPALVATFDEPVSERPGTVIGPYKLLQQIGEGGFGVVFLAEQTQPVRRKVALKVLKPGMDTRQVVARFEAERQALAIMDHPNIAKVFDGGATPSGRPYFVMELVKGVPITDFCDHNHLTPRQRLELFVPVCQAIQHAHQKGVIHRDVKPSNVLVAPYDGRPVVKVIDFGVAKAAGQPLTDHTLVTGFGALVGTLEYMSPEQAELNNQDIDTRSDIYSLGVLLYELLTGTPPFSRKELEKAGMLEMLRVIREQEPTKPSTKLSTAEGLATLAANRGTEPAKLTKLVRGELDWIVMKALEKDRNRRYETASALAADVQRYLNDEPVQACPPSLGYLLRKFVSRNKGPVLAAGLVLLALLGGGVGVAFGLLWHQAEVARGEAEAARDGETKAKQEAEDAREKLAAEEYGRTMQVAHQEWRDNNVAAALALLDSTRADFRGWEWRYVHRLCHSELLTLPIYTDTAFAISADGSRMVTGAPGLTGVVRDARTGAELLSLKWLPSSLNGRPLSAVNGKRVCPTSSASFSADGSRVVTGSWGSTVRVWDVRTETEVLAFTARDPGGAVWSVMFNPDGSQVLTSGDQTARVWDARSGAALLTLRGHTSDVHAASFSPDGSRIVTASDDTTARVWDATSGVVIFTLRGHTDRIRSASFSPDGARVLTGSWDGTARVWDASKGTEVLILKGHTDRVNAVSFSPDGLRAVTASKDKTARVWDARNGAELLTLKGHTDAVTAVSFSADGSRVRTASKDKTTRVWDAVTEAEVLTLRGHTDEVNSASFSPDGSRAVTASKDKTARVWDAGNGAELLTLRGHTEGVLSASFSPDGSRVLTASADRTAKVWDARTGVEVLVLKGHTDMVQGASWSPDGLRLLTGSSDQTARVWDARSGAEILILRGHASAILSASWSADGSRVVATSFDETVRVWDAWTGAELLTLQGHTSAVSSASFTPDGLRVATASQDGTARVWDARTGAELLTLKGLTPGVIVGSWSADGSRLLTRSTDGTARVWDARTGTELLTLKGHTAGVKSASFSPDGSRILTSGDRTTRVWDARTGAEVLTLKGHTGAVTAASWSADGARVLTCGDKAAMVWDATPVPKSEGVVTAPRGDRP